MKGEKTQILGNVGDFEVGAKWQWKIEIPPKTIWLLSLILILLLCTATSCLSLWIQFNEVSRIQDEKIQELSKNQVELSAELVQIKKLNEELSLKLAEPSQNLLPISSEHIRSKRTSPNNKGRGKKSNQHINEANASKQKKKTVSQLSPYSPKHSHVTAVHLERNVSYAVTGSNGKIDHWFPQNWLETTSNYLENVQLDDRNSTLIIQSTGLYIIYAQLCYAATKENNSFEMRLMNQGLMQSQSKTIALCSAGTSSLENEITCFTSSVQVLKAGDKVFLQQMQKNRQLLMNNGRSFMGIIKLSN